MEIINVSYPEIPDVSETVCCIGNFDGVHLGHQKLLQRAVQLAAEKDLKASVITFWPDPDQIFSPCENRRYLTTEKTKLGLFEEYGIDTVYIFSFEPVLYTLTPKKFVKYLNCFRINTLICGFDFTYGSMGKGNPKVLSSDKNRNFSVEVIDCQSFDNQKISSTRILRLIREGNMSQALHLLNHSYEVFGYVTEGRFASQVNQLPQQGSYKVLINDRQTEITINDYSFEIDGENGTEAVVKFPFDMGTEN